MLIGSGVGAPASLPFCIVILLALLARRVLWFEAAAHHRRWVETEEALRSASYGPGGLGDGRPRSYPLRRPAASTPRTSALRAQLRLSGQRRGLAAGSVWGGPSARVPACSSWRRGWPHNLYPPRTSVRQTGVDVRAGEPPSHQTVGGVPAALRTSRRRPTIGDGSPRRAARLINRLCLPGDSFASPETRTPPTSRRRNLSPVAQVRPCARSIQQCGLAIGSMRACDL